MEEKIRQMMPLLMSENRADREMAMQLCEGQGVDKIEAIKAAIRETRFEVDFEHYDKKIYLTEKSFLSEGTKEIAYRLCPNYYFIEGNGYFEERENLWGSDLNYSDIDDCISTYSNGDVYMYTLVNDKERAMHIFKQKAPSEIDKRISELEAEIAALKASRERINNL